MSYSITYTWEKEKELVIKYKMPVTMYLAITAVVAALGIRILFPKSSEVFQELLHPLTDEFTIASFAELVEQVGSGTPLSEAATTFCTEIINHAQ